MSFNKSNIIYLVANQTLNTINNDLYGYTLSLNGYIIKLNESCELLNIINIPNSFISKIINDNSYNWYIVYYQLTNDILNNYLSKYDHLDNLKNITNLNGELEVLQHTLKRDYFSYSFPKGSTLITEINPVLIATLKSMEWNNLIKNF